LVSSPKIFGQRRILLHFFENEVDSLNKGVSYSTQRERVFTWVIISWQSSRSTIGKNWFTRSVQNRLRSSFRINKQLKVLIVFSISIIHKNKSRFGNVFVTQDSSLNIFGTDSITRFIYWTVPLNRVCSQVAPTTCRRNIVQNENRER
jgi:hypothetical protein